MLIYKQDVLDTYIFQLPWIFMVTHLKQQI